MSEDRNTNQTYCMQDPHITTAERFYPTDDRILVRRVNVERCTDGGIVMPDSAVTESIEAVVVTVGPGAWIKKGTERRRSLVRPGDHVMLDPHADIPLILADGVRYSVINEPSILGVIDWEE